MNVLGLTNPQSKIDLSTLTDRYVADAKQYLFDKLETAEGTHNSSAQQAANAAFCFQATAIVMLAIPFAWPAAVMYQALALGMFILVSDETGKASDIAACQTGLKNEIDVSAGTTDREANALSNATAGTSGYLVLKSALANEQSKLDSMLGRASGGAVTAADVTRAIVTAASAQHVDLNEILDLANTGISEQSQKLDLRALVDRYIGAATGAVHPAADAATAVDDMLYDAQTGRENAFSTLEQWAGALAEAQLKNEQAYQKALNDLAQVPLEDPAHPSEAYRAADLALQDAARRAYLDPSYRTSDHLNRLLSLEQSLQSEVDPSKHPELDQAQQDLLGSQQRELAALWQDRMKGYLAVQEQQWALMQEDLIRQQSQWQATMGAILKRAESQWDTAFRTIDAQYTSWQGAFARAYEDRATTWDASYAKLETSKARWVQDAATKAASVGSVALLSQLGQSAEGAIKDARNLVVSDLGIDTPDARAAVAGVLEGKDFASLLASGKIVNRGINSAGSVVFAQLGPEIFDSSRVLRRIGEMSSLNTEEIDRHVLLITATEARKAVDAAASKMNEQIDEANQSVADGLESSLLGAGFVRTGDNFQRQTVVDSTINGPVTELHIVPAYKPYVPDAEIAPKVDLSDERLLQLSASGIQAQVELAIKDMTGQMEAIFGKQNAKGKAIITTWKSNSHDEMVTQDVLVGGGNGQGHTVTQTTSTSLTTRDATSAEVEIGGGAFGQYVGIAPKMETEYADVTAGEGELSKYLSADGSGQLGKVLTPFYWSQMKESVGWSMVARPIYDQKLWDDRSSWVKAPTMRGVADIGAAVLGTMTGGVSGVLLGLAEKGLFTAADVVNGQMSADEGLFNFTKSALSSVFTFGMGQLGTVVGDSLQAVNGVAGTIAKTMWSGAQGFTTNLGQGLINSFTYTNEDGFGLNGEAFAQSVVGQQALAGYLGGMASTATSGLLAGNLRGFSKLNTEDVLSVSNLTGGLVSSGIQYAMTGEATFNVLNFTDLSGNRKWNTGLVEMHLGGSQGFSMNLGSNGTDVSLGTIGRAMQGMGTFVEQQRIRWYDATGGMSFSQGYNGNRQVGTLLRENYSFGDNQAQTQLDRLLSGRDTLRVGYITNPGETVAVGDSRVVNLATLGMSGDINSQLAAGIMLEHEAYRNGVDDGANGQAYETQIAALGHTQMALRVASEYGFDVIAENANLTSDVAAYLKGPAAFSNYMGANYDSSADYWKLKIGGTLEWDNSRDLNVEYVGADGKVHVREGFVKDKTGSFSQSLVNYLGGTEVAKEMLSGMGMSTSGKSDADIAYLLMRAKGAQWDESTGQYVADNSLVQPADRALSMGDRLSFQTQWWRMNGGLETAISQFCDDMAPVEEIKLRSRLGVGRNKSPRRSISPPHGKSISVAE